LATGPGFGDAECPRFRLRSQDDFDGVNDETRSETEAGVQAEHAFDFADLSPVWRRRPMSGTSPRDPNKVHDRGTWISDGQAGGFRLGVFTLAVR